jgi:hypothetical protein
VRKRLPRRSKSWIRAAKVLVLGDRNQFGNIKTSTASREVNGVYMQDLMKVFSEEFVDASQAVKTKIDLFDNRGVGEAALSRRKRIGVARSQKNAPAPFIGPGFLVRKPVWYAPMVGRHGYQRLKG